MGDNGKDRKITTLSQEVRQLTINMVSRIQAGSATLDKLEKALLQQIFDKDGALLNKDVNYLLKLCQYFRGSVSTETASVWQFIANLQRGRIPPGAPNSELSTEDISGDKKEILDMDPVKREEMRKGLEAVK